jgi:hypothetical protein
MADLWKDDAEITVLAPAAAAAVVREIACDVRLDAVAGSHFVPGVATFGACRVGAHSASSTSTTRRRAAGE